VTGEENAGTNEYDALRVIVGEFEKFSALLLPTGRAPLSGKARISYSDAGSGIMAQ
jgi:hypothetical protein